MFLLGVEGWMADCLIVLIRDEARLRWRSRAYDEFDRTVKALEDSMGICMS